MKIALTHPYSWPEVRRGAERIIMETARALAARGHDVAIFSAGSRASDQRNDGVRIVRFRRIWKRDWIHERWFGWRITPHLALGGFDATHAFMPCDALAAIRAKRLGGRHHSLYDEMGVPWLNWDGKRDASARKRVVAGIDTYGCMSEYALDALRAGSDRRGVRIPGGVRMAEFQPAGRREPTPTLLFSGAFEVPFKGVSTLLEALALVAEKEPDVKLWLSGPGDGAVLLRAAPVAAAQRTEILPLGEPGDQALRYGTAWATVLPSRRESFGMVMLESLACGTPVVTTNEGAPQELVTPSTGAVAEAGDVCSLADALLRAIELARGPTTVAACRDAAASYDWDDAIAPLLEGLYAGGPAA